MSANFGFPSWVKYFEDNEFFKTSPSADTSSPESLESRQARINSAYETIADAKNKMRDLLTDYQIVVESQIELKYANITTRSALILLPEIQAKIISEVQRIADARKILVETKPN